MMRELCFLILFGNTYSELGDPRFAVREAAQLRANNFLFALLCPRPSDAERAHICRRVERRHLGAAEWAFLRLVPRAYFEFVLMRGRNKYVSDFEVHRFIVEMSWTDRQKIFLNNFPPPPEVGIGTVMWKINSEAQAGQWIYWLNMYRPE